MDPKISWWSAGTNAPRPSTRAGSNENLAGSASQSLWYSKLIASPPRRAWRCSVPTRFSPGVKSIWTSISATIALGYAPQPNSLRQLLAGDGNACSVATYISDLTQLIKKSERLKHCGVDANAHGWISLFDALKSWPTGKGAFSHNPGREPATSSRVPEVVPELAQGSSDANGRPMRGGHKCNRRVP